MECKKLSIDELEVLKILVAFINVSDEHFKECVEYVKNTEMHPETREFLEKCLEITSKRRVSDHEKRYR